MKTITIQEVKECGVSTFSKQDNSPRGITTVMADELQIGDKIVIENSFVTIVE